MKDKQNKKIKHKKQRQQAPTRDMEQEQKKGLIYAIFFQFNNADDNKMCCSGYHSTNHTPFQRKWQHCIRHKDNEQHIPNHAFTIRKTDTLTNEPWSIGKKQKWENVENLCIYRFHIKFTLNGPTAQNHTIHTHRSTNILNFLFKTRTQTRFKLGTEIMIKSILYYAESILPCKFNRSQVHVAAQCK